MESPQIIDEICNPTKVIQRLYDAHCDGADSFPTVVASHFSDFFFGRPDDGHTVKLNQLPPLDVHHPPESYTRGTLVRFRAMIQDTSLSPEIYLAHLGGRCCGWGMSAQAEQGADIVDGREHNYLDLREASIVWAVSVPGESQWRVDEMSPSVVRACWGFSAHVPPQPHKFPIPGMPHIGVQAKIYDTARAQPLRVTDVVTFVGILSIEPLYSELGSPVGEAPVLHVICYQLVSVIIPKIINPLTVRQELINWVSEHALGGDDLAAEWLLLQLASRVHSRAAPFLPPSLTISHFPHPPQPEELPILSCVLAELLPQHTSIPLSVELLNSQVFVPESREEDLHAGYLQLPAGTTVLLTESALREGKVDEKGLANIRAIQDIMNCQTLEYNFPFSKFMFETDISVIILTEGRQSTFFQTNLTVPLQSSSYHAGNLYQSRERLVLPSPEKLRVFRSYTASCKAASGKVRVSEETSKYIQQDFVRKRQEDKSVTAQDLVHLMKVVRLHAASRLEHEVTIEMWEKTKELEARRKERLVYSAVGSGHAI